MLLLETLRNKPYLLKDGENIRDLTASSVEFNGPLFVQSTGVVSSDFVMRADLIAKVYFRNANKLDYLLKFNGISNPFSLNENDIVLIPDMDEMKLALKPKKAKDSTATKDAIIKKFFDPNRLSKTDKKRLDYLAEKSASLPNGSKTNLPPNFSEPGSKELKVVDGKVIFGGDTVPNNKHCIDPLSKARAKSKILQNKIFNNTRDIQKKNN
jgi:hypothetical protein